MPEGVTRTGLHVVRQRAFDRDDLPNPNPPIGTVGPNVPAGFGDTHVLYPGYDPPIEAQAWAGWPVGWEAPWTGQAGWYTRGRVSTVFAAIDLNARAVASMPIYVTRLPDEVRVASPPAWVTNPAPGLYSSWVDAAKQVIWSYQMRGNVYLWALSRYADGSVRSFAVLNPDRVEVTRDPDGYPAYTYVGWDNDGTYTSSAGAPYVARLDADDVCHITYARWPGDLYGHGPLVAAAGNLASAARLEAYGEDLAARGGIPWGVLSAPYELTRDEVDRLRSEWTSASSRRGGAPAIVSGGFDLKTLTISPREMALLELREYDEGRIAIALGVQPYMLGLPQGDGMTYSNASSLFDWHWRATLRPFTTDIAAAVGAWALPRGRALRFDPDAYIRPALEDRVAAYQTLVALGVMTADDIRRREGLVTDTDTTPTGPPT